MIVRTTLEERGPLTAEEIESLKKAQMEPISYDEDSPALSAEQLSEFIRIKDVNRNKRVKQPVTLRLSQQSIDTAKSLGKGYTSVLGRILENILSNPDMLKYYL
ncbi:MAG: BrnA antitoxin family protein [Eubacteriales bacterium]|nr:BrnA antitoxin family protein [Lachnospiraceae bacterium]MDO4808457.1 BrnA antitoxin family protein [Eubacteriales bacterium]